MRSVWKFFIIGSVLLAIGVIAPDIVLAQCTDGFCPLAEVKGTKLATLYSDTGGDLSIFIGRLFGFALSIGAILAILRIAWGGYLYMTTDLWSTKERAREVLRETVLGLLLLLAVYIILHQINPAILDLNLNITPAPPGGQVSESAEERGGFCYEITQPNPLGGNTVSYGCFNTQAECTSSASSNSYSSSGCSSF